MSRWHDLRDAMKRSNMSAADKAVYRYLLDCADYATAELSPRYTPTRKAIARATSLSFSMVGKSTVHCGRHDWLEVKGATAPGRPLEYRLKFGSQCDCTGRVHHAGYHRLQPANGATTYHRSVLTDGANATAQHTSSTERQREGGGCKGSEDQKPEGLSLRDIVVCPRCGAEGIVGVRLIEHEAGCWRGFALSMYDAERGS